MAKLVYAPRSLRDAERVAVECDCVALRRVCALCRAESRAESREGKRRRAVGRDWRGFGSRAAMVAAQRAEGAAICGRK